MIACSTKTLPRAKPAICKTSHPLHTGFSPDFGAGDIGGDSSGGNGSTTSGTGACDSLFSGGSNSGLAGDDKNVSSHWITPLVCHSYSAGHPSRPQPRILFV